VGLERSKLFCQDVFGLPVTYEDENSVLLKFGNTLIKLLTIPAAGELIEPGVVAGRQAGSRFQLAIWVDNADAVCAELARQGDPAEWPDGPGMGQCTAIFTNPDGHI
jgi:catechol 2,3-dioxygenase-like lactoylglutathione lyase family enzyme